MRRALLTAGLAVACVVWALARVVHAEDTGAVAVTERTVKAAYLFKFAGYVEWPDGKSGASAPVTIGVLDARDMADELARITAGRLINDRPVQVRQISSSESLAGIHVLFVGDEAGDRLRELLLPVLERPILTVTESAGALASGSIINFTVDHERVRFEVSLPAAERSRLKLSSRLLAVAQRVQRTSGS